MQRAGTHVIVVGNEKGGSGKSTTAVHLAVYLLHYGFRVASIDADSRQQTFTAYIKNRRAWAEAHALKIRTPRTIICRSCAMTRSRRHNSGSFHCSAKR